MISPRSERAEAGLPATEPLAVHTFYTKGTKDGLPVTGPPAVHSSDIGWVEVDPLNAYPPVAHTLMKSWSTGHRNI